jgi:hypothetical protein
MVIRGSFNIFIYLFINLLFKTEYNIAEQYTIEQNEPKALIQ